MGSSRRMKLGGDPQKTLNEGPAQGQTQGQNHGGAGNGPGSHTNGTTNGAMNGKLNGASNGGGEVEMGDARKSGGSMRNSMRSRHSADEVSCCLCHTSHVHEVCTLQPQLQLLWTTCGHSWL